MDISSELVEAKATALSDIDRERLGDLISAYDQRASFGWPTSQVDGRVLDGVAPLDCGGTNSSDHSYRLTKLAKAGLAEHRKRGYEWGWAPGPGRRYRGSKLYRPTELGRLVYARGRELATGERSS